jgi:superfamily I DNA/RNA helicase
VTDPRKNPLPRSCVCIEPERRGARWVFYTAPFVGQAVKEALDRAHIPVDWLKDSLSKNFNPRLDSVRLMTAHSSKGLQYQVVIVAGAGFLPYRSERDDAKVMYVALTRATRELIITTSRASSFSQRLRELCAPLTALQSGAQVGSHRTVTR